jgi:hypothetical protein
MYAQAGTPGTMKTSSLPAGIASDIRVSGDRKCLILQNNERDVLSFCAAAAGAFVPKLQSAYLRDDQLAVVLDYDLWLQYERYSLEKGVWALKSKAAFNSLNGLRRQQLILVELMDATHVRITSAKNSESLSREKGKIDQSDQQDIFEFSINGILKNGSAYTYTSGRESN